MVHRLDDVTTADGTDYPRTGDKKTVKKEPAERGRVQTDGGERRPGEWVATRKVRHSRECNPT